MKTSRVMCYQDGTITYWSVYEQVWQHRASTVPDRELAAMDGRTRERVIRFLREQEKQKV